jgi:ubiquinone/menaquinone biosynthesis C-methylase UbiE
MGNTRGKAFRHMGFYEHWVLPSLIHAAMRQRNLSGYRQRVIPAASGRVLEIGVGSGLNFAFYGRDVERVIALDPSPRLLHRAEKSARDTTASVELIEASAEAIPLPDRSIDTVVSTWTLCSIPNVTRALGEIRRVLKPGGRLLFAEHGLSPDAAVRGWQNRLTPAWKRLGGGCHLNRDIANLIASAGFDIERVTTGYMKGPKPMTYMYEGSARIAEAAQQAG